MKVHDNRHLNYVNMVQVGDMVITNKDKKYLFTYDKVSKDYPYLIIDVKTFEVVGGFSTDAFNNLKVSANIGEEDYIKEIIKCKNLILDIRG